MPRVQYTTAKGLFQDTGAGVKLTQEASSANAFANTGLLIGRDASNVNPFSKGTTQLFPLGTRLVYGDREYRYAKAGGTITVGCLCQSPALDGNFVNKAIADLDAGTLAAITFTNGDSALAKTHDPAIGSRAICADNLGGDLVKDFFAEGFLITRDEAGQGQALKIRTHEPVDISGGSSRTTLVIETYDPLHIALTKNVSEISLIQNPYKGVVLAPGTETGAIVGVAVLALVNNDFAWLQTKGPAAVLGGGSIAAGDKCMRDQSDDLGGVLIAADSAEGAKNQVIGNAMEAMVDTEHGLVMLNIQ